MTEQDPLPTAAAGSHGRLTWDALVRWLAAFVLVLTGVVGVASGDRETLVIAVGLLVGNALLRWRTGLAGTIVIGVLAADIAFWMYPAAVSNVANSEPVGAVVVPATFAVSSTVLLVAVGFSLAGRRRPARGGAGPMVALGAGVGVVAVAAVVGFVGGADGPQPGDVAVVMRDTAFVPDEVAVPAGRTAFYVTNDDLFWHTFAIEGSGVDVRIPTRGHRRIELDLDPGTYDLVCTIPGHESLGMTGVVEVG